jgi:antitoxin (DNA-binding transcriptional repressor) of toxin-antitoxin stability system
MKTRKVNIGEAKTHFSKYTALVKQGERVILCDRNVPFAEIRPLSVTKEGKRPFGLAAGKIHLNESFFQSDKEIAELFTGNVKK